ncbi:MAG: hypothetical protein B6I20_13090 [Bacteroidetes bacterium 4572_117]|nr:MAG: hypothetical protein B6I20_13090 [Bacteroidetes bacterium 4572_117]
MIIAPVLMEANNWFEKMQALDFFSLMASGAGASGINRPIMNNAANLAFSKEAYLSINDPTNHKISSGDDVFFLLKLKKRYPKKTLFLKSENAIVYTKAKKSISSFINQRKRWASKSKHYRDFDIIYTAITVLSINLFLLLALIFAIFLKQILFVFLTIFVLKLIFDFVFLYKTASVFKQKNILWYFLPVQLANLFFIPYFAFAGLFTKVKWKGKQLLNLMTLAK